MYVLVVRDIDGVRLGTVSTGRHLWQVKKLLLSLFRQFEQAVAIDVLVWPWMQEGGIERQNVLVSARRSDELVGAMLWARERDLKVMEKELERAEVVQ